jgi:hypothetical protein
VRLLWAATFGAIYGACRQARLVGYLAYSGVRRVGGRQCSSLQSLPVEPN